MDVTAIAALASDMAAARTQQAISMSVLKMAMNQQGDAALALLASATDNTQAVVAAVAGSLGQNIDTFV